MGTCGSYKYKRGGKLTNIHNNQNYRTSVKQGSRSTIGFPFPLSGLYSYGSYYNYCMYHRVISDALLLCTVPGTTLHTVVRVLVYCTGYVRASRSDSFWADVQTHHPKRIRTARHQLELTYCNKQHDQPSKQPHVVVLFRLPSLVYVTSFCLLLLENASR